MSEALTQLKKFGVQKIYEDTHIPINHVQAILEENYEGLTRVQYLGFISILEREYKLDLKELNERAVAHYNEKDLEQPLADDGIFVVPSKQKNFTPFYIVVVILIFLAALYYTLEVADKKNETLLQKQSVKENKNKSVVAPMVADVNMSEANSSEANTTMLPDETQAVSSPAKPKSVALEPLEILPRSKVWLGYIDVATGKKYQKTFSDELDLNASKEWLLLFGHGYIDLLVDGKKISFSDKNNLRLHYKNGELEKISLREFTKLNRGRKW